MTTANPRKRKPSIALIGLRGCGKTTVGRELAALLGGDFFDTDEAVAEDAGRSIAVVFAEEREAGFRRRERAAIAKVAANPPAVISVGGGAVLDKENVQTLRAVATIVWLTAPPHVLSQRVSADPTTPDSRPPLTGRGGLAEVEHLLAERAPDYHRAADLVIDTVGRSPRDVARIIVTRLQTDKPHRRAAEPG